MTPTELDLPEHPDGAPPLGDGRDGVPVADVLAALDDHGFRLTSTGSHVLATRDHERVVVAVHSPHLPPVVLRRLDWSLGQWLGRGRLIEASSRRDERTGRPVRIGSVPPAPTGTEPSIEVNAVVEHPTADGPWCTFLLEEPSVMGFGPTRIAALEDVAAATATWLGTAPSAVLVRPVDHR
jgi:predicted RNA binding protein YcfA (HicA-like mRNA interferase family)